MGLRAYRSLQALVLAGLGFYLLVKVLDGRILLYINQRFVLLVLLGALGMIFLAQLVMRERPLPGEETAHGALGHDHAAEAGEARQGWVLWLLALPLLMGLLVPERPLGASALQNRGINTASGLSAYSGSTQASQIPPAQRSVLDWIRAAGEPAGADALRGQPADVTGFVYHDARLGAGQFMVSRFAIACCVADASAMGMVVYWPGAAGLPENGWVRVRGQVTAVEFVGRQLPAIQAEQVEAIPPLEQPYLFP